MHERILHWDGCANVRDLGGLHTCDGYLTRRKSILRSDTPSSLTPLGWSALYDYGIRTIVTLGTRGLTEAALTIIPPFPDIKTVRVEIEDVTDEEFVQKWADTELWSTPLYYKDALRRWPERHAAAMSAIAQAGPDGILFHCIRGHDRTGIIALLLLTLVGVTPEEIIADYQLSLDPERDEILARNHTTIRKVLLNALDGLDIDSYLCMGGASQDDLSTIRRRLLG